MRKKAIAGAGAALTLAMSIGLASPASAATVRGCRPELEYEPWHLHRGCYRRQELQKPHSVGREDHRHSPTRRISKQARGMGR